LISYLNMHFLIIIIIVLFVTCSFLFLSFLKLGLIVVKAALNNFINVERCLDLIIFTVSITACHLQEYVVRKIDINFRAQRVLFGYLITDTTGHRFPKPQQRMTTVFELLQSFIFQ